MLETLSRSGNIYGETNRTMAKKIFATKGYLTINIISDSFSTDVAWFCILVLFEYWIDTKHIYKQVTVVESYSRGLNAACFKEQSHLVSQLTKP